MNTETNQNTSAVRSTGERLRLAREAMGLSQQNVADRLCLKLSTVRDIEEDQEPPELVATFLRGYIRSYARLVRIPEEELLPALTKQVPLRTSSTTPMQSYTLKSRRPKKKRDGLLGLFTWLIFIIVIGLTVTWWWQNHKAGDELSVSTPQANDKPASGEQSIPLSLNNGESTAVTPAGQDASVNVPAQSATQSAPATAQESDNRAGTSAVTQTAPQSTANPTAPSSTTESDNAAPPATEPADTAATQTADDTSTHPSSDALLLNFSGDCWLEVSDAQGKKLFSGMQRRGASLNLQGQLPYKLKIGAPAAVNIQFRGQPVDLSRFVRNNQVARLSVGAQ